ncbi:hypothetical protein EMCG_06684 [[Emmonsia] crescens]|uniref:Uncharacterized protein n=1 Tax=[Emmonsia] crescens TaxID=73230 RepID=A0A0G2J6H0_9EURO|nr:hypothetical protein EMCG_06684 [Emmonsia crescens UAMH 3008]
MSKESLVFRSAKPTIRQPTGVLCFVLTEFHPYGATEKAGQGGVRLRPSLSTGAAFYPPAERWPHIWC